MSKTKPIMVLIEVEGGVVQDVSVTDHAVQVYLLDQDNLEAITDMDEVDDIGLPHLCSSTTAYDIGTSIHNAQSKARKILKDLEKENQRKCRKCGQAELITNVNGVRFSNIAKFSGLCKPCISEELGGVS